jgi:hypothetical protein
MSVCLTSAMVEGIINEIGNTARNYSLKILLNSLLNFETYPNCCEVNDARATHRNSYKSSCKVVDKNVKRDNF